MKAIPSLLFLSLVLLAISQPVTSPLPNVIQGRLIVNWTEIENGRVSVYGVSNTYVGTVNYASSQIISQNDTVLLGIGINATVENSNYQINAPIYTWKIVSSTGLILATGEDKISDNNGPFLRYHLIQLTGKPSSYRLEIAITGLWFRGISRDGTVCTVNVKLYEAATTQIWQPPPPEPGKETRPE